MGRLCFNDVLLCEPRMIDPSMSTGLWWCQSPEDVQAVGVNAVCLSVTRRWEDVKNCGDWLSQFPFVFVASPDRELVEQVRRHVRGLPVLSPPPARKKFVPPTLKEVSAYCLEKHYHVDPELFVDHYEANGWKQGRGKPIVDWKAAVRTWERRDRSCSPERTKEDDGYGPTLL